MRSRLEEKNDARSAPRANMFLAAALRVGGSLYDVRIRDMSPSGAQIEGATLPDVGSIVEIARGNLNVRGVIAWSIARRCGIRFSNSVSTRDWLSAKTNKGQNRVDRIVDALRAGALPMEPPAMRPETCDGRLVEDLGCVVSLIEQLEDGLAVDASLVEQHGILLQNIDLAKQLLSVLAETLSENPNCTSAEARLHQLRLTCAEALN